MVVKFNNYYSLKMSLEKIQGVEKHNHTSHMSVKTNMFLSVENSLNHIHKI